MGSVAGWPRRSQPPAPSSGSAAARQPSCPTSTTVTCTGPRSGSHAGGGGTIAGVIGKRDSIRASRLSWRQEYLRCRPGWTWRTCSPSSGAAAASPDRAGSAASTSSTRCPACCSASVTAAASTDAPAPGEPARTGTTTPNRLQSTAWVAAAGTASRDIAAAVAPIPAAMTAGSSTPGAATSGAAATTAFSTAAPGRSGAADRAAAAKTGCSSSTAPGGGCGVPRSMSCMGERTATGRTA